MRVPVVDKNHQPLMPTTPARARKWVESGKAVKRTSDCGQFYVQLTGEPSGRATQDIVIGIDPGKKFSGIGVQSAKFTLYTAHLILPFQTVRDRMDARRLMRRGRRGRRIDRKVNFLKRAHRQKRFDNRRQGKLPPSIRANRQLELRIVSELCKIYPISEIRYEYVRADVDLTSGRKKARSGKGFSAVMVGQKWMLKQLEQFAPVAKVEGYQTASTRKYLGLTKNSSDKSKSEFNTHAVDGVAIAATAFVEYRQYHTVKVNGGDWFGNVVITFALFKLIRRPPYSRRQLHLMVPAKSGVRRKYGGSTTRHGLRKGDLVTSPKGIGYVSGDTEKQVSVSDANWKRLGQIASSKVQLISRSNGLIVA
ncbi:RRXRR domain-containing protein (plasmid) [Anabaena sp. FACHB-709]|nr:MULTISPECIES: RRXRR domain-containing protein [Nostocaceae]MBD2174985.1 RRXRR domain-containing protein [Anabaena cylindrica FACHB-318]MBD2266661.1 RRXRR domain-containing protein [Anabaena sp. FACHB-709]MBD2276245.1 RRXRR domain-containing protein [Nostoc sp. PCC 7120 = FACHB-418]MBD2286991.1 RRXRR domain-containing protein [Anabaena cylindrica FACHB-170]MBD2352694.1 RRXRR domain-containing protein [Trichormus variabilis FACHB-171]